MDVVSGTDTSASGGVQRVLSGIRRLTALAGGAADDLGDVYLFEGEGRVSYLSPRADRPPGVTWVARTRRSFLAADAEEFAASVPRPTATRGMSRGLRLAGRGR